MERDEGFFVAADGVRLAWRSIGSGPTVVIPNGDYFLDDLAPLAAGRRLLAYDPRNRGRSAAVSDDAALGIDRDVDDLETVRREVGGEGIALLGHSYAGLLAALYASRHPQRVERLVLVGPMQLDRARSIRPSYAATRRRRRRSSPASAKRSARQPSFRPPSAARASGRCWRSSMSRTWRTRRESLAGGAASSPTSAASSATGCACCSRPSRASTSLPEPRRRRPPGSRRARPARSQCPLRRRRGLGHGAARGAPPRRRRCGSRAVVERPDVVLPALAAFLAPR